MRSKLAILLATLGVALLGGCATPAPKPERAQNSDILTAETILKPAAPLAADEKVQGLSISPETKSDRPPPAPEIQVGTASFYKPQPPVRASTGEGQVTFNFENQPVQAVVKAILGDMLQENYTIAPNVGGNVTYSTSRPIRREDALPVLEMLLSWTGNALVREGNRYTVLQAKDAIPGKLTPNVGASQQPGYGLRIFPLKYISSTEAAKLLKPYSKPESLVQADTNRSLIVLAGTPTELANYQRIIDTFDIDWMKGMSIGVYAMQHVEVTKLMPDLQKIFGTEGESPLAGMFRFMPIEQTNSMIVITPQPEYLRQAEEWLRRLDQGGKENTVQLYVYNVKNLKAGDLGDYLSQIFLGTSSGTRSSNSGRVGQGLRSTTLGSRGGSGNMGGNNMNYQGSLRPQSNQEKAEPASAPSAPAAAGGSGNKDTNIRISAIEENNQLMIQATPFEWDQIESAIKRLDVVPLQVQIEARILEVSLTGELSYGVQWYLNGMMGTATGSAQENGRYPYPEVAGNRWDRHRLTLGATGNVAPSNNGGFFYSFLSKKFEVALSALETDGVAKSLAAPSLLVMNNQEAQINVGEQIPVRQTYFTGIAGIGNNGNTIGGGYGTVQYLNTGVSLVVKPRVNPGGLVYLDIQQEVSNRGASAPEDNPPINQRQLSTQVAVQSGETLMLGGLIRDDGSEGNKGLPLVSKVPVLRNLFGTTTKSSNRTELIVLITPRVISSVDEARQATLEYTRQFQSLAPLRPAAHSTSTPAPESPQPARTYPVQEITQPQEEPSRDH